MKGLTFGMEYSEESIDVGDMDLFKGVFANANIKGRTGADPRERTTELPFHKLEIYGRKGEGNCRPEDSVDGRAFVDNFNYQFVQKSLILPSGKIKVTVKAKFATICDTSTVPSCRFYPENGIPKDREGTIPDWDAGSIFATAMKTGIEGLACVYEKNTYEIYTDCRLNGKDQEKKLCHTDFMNLSPTLNPNKVKKW